MDDDVRPFVIVTTGQRIPRTVPTTFQYAPLGAVPCTRRTIGCGTHRSGRTAYDDQAQRGSVRGAAVVGHWVCTTLCLFDYCAPTHEEAVESWKNDGEVSCGDIGESGPVYSHEHLSGFRPHGRE